MLLRLLREEEKELFNSVVRHPLQSWQWGEFRKKTGIQVERLGFFENGKLKNAIQVFFHPVPHLNRTVGYFPKGYMPDEDQLMAVRQLAEQHQAIYVKMEPNIAHKVGVPSGHQAIHDFLLKKDCVPGKPLFTKYTFTLDLTQSSEELMANLSSKTRYNINLAAKKGVQIFENTSQAGMEQYIEILEETTKRQGFYAHNPSYFRTLWEILGDSGMLRIYNAVYENKVLASWIMFVFNKVLYYPYGASRAINREVMASNLLMWEMIQFGKAQGCTSFDMWGSLGPDPNPKDPWFGFHRFKKGYGGDLVEFLGTYDQVIDQPWYQIVQFIDTWRWKLLRLRKKLGI